MKKGDKVHWNWGRGEGEGTVIEKFEEPVEIKIKGTEVKRNASKEEPAYLIRQEDGDQVLKSGSEFTKGKKQ